MLKKTITYTDYNDVERTEDFYFNLTKTEVLELETSVEGGLEQRINKIVASKDTNQVVKIFKEIILKAYGEKSEDGKYFEKSETISNRFSQTPAYDQLFMELATDDKAAAAFINGIVPRVDDKKVSKFENNK